MNTFEMTDSELYEIGVKILTDKLGASQVPRFIRQIRPGKGDYSVDRHKLLANEPDIDTIVKQIQERRPAREAEERARAKRFAAPQSEIRKMTDIEIYEIGNQVLVDKLGPDGLMGFIMQCQELNGGPRHDRIQSAADAERAIKFYTASLRLNPKIVEDYIRRGTAYSYIGKHTKAIGDYTAALKLKPNYAEAYYNRGTAYAVKGEVDAAIQDYNKAIELNPENAYAYYNRGAAYAVKGEVDAAIQDYNKAIDLNPENAEVYNNRGTAYAKKDEVDAAIQDYNKAIDLNPENAEVYNNRGTAYAKKGAFDAAIQAYNDAIELNSNEADAYYNRCKVWLHLKEWERAEADLTAVKNMGIDIAALFQDYESIEEFEAEHGVTLPEDLAALLRGE